MDRGCAASGVAVHLAHNQAGQPHPAVEPFGGVDGVLPGHGVDDQQDFVGGDGLFDLLQLFHQPVVDLQAAAGVDNSPVDAKLLRPLQAGPGHLDNGRRLRVFGIDGDVQLPSQGFQLLDGGGTPQVGGDEERATALLTLL